MLFMCTCQCVCVCVCIGGNPTTSGLLVLHLHKNSFMEWNLFEWKTRFLSNQAIWLDFHKLDHISFIFNTFKYPNRITILDCKNTHTHTQKTNNNNKIITRNSSTETLIDDPKRGSKESSKSKWLYRSKKIQRLFRQLLEHSSYQCRLCVCTESK